MKRALILAVPVALGACATQPQAPAPAAEAPAPARPYTAADFKVPPRPDPGPIGDAGGRRASRSEVRKMMKDQMEQATVLPTLNCFVGAACEYWYEKDGPRYLVLMEQGDKTDVQLQPGETVKRVEQAGNKVRIPYDRYHAGPPGPDRVERIAFTPRLSGVKTNITIATDRRFYELRAETTKAGTGENHHLVKWRYIEDVIAEANGAPTAYMHDPNTDRVTGLDARTRWCGYRIAALDVPFMPEKTADDQPPVCDDGEVTVVNFPLGALDGGGPTVHAVRDGTQFPVQYEQVDGTYRVAGVHQHLRLSLGAYEIDIQRRAQR